MKTMRLFLARPEKHNEAGQSLVEMAVIVPLLLFIFIGLVEVGWALFNYMDLLGATREAARYGARADTLPQPKVDQSPILPRFLMAAADNRLDVDMTDNTTVIIQYIEVDTGYPCQDGQLCSFNCDAIHASAFWFQDDIVSRTGTLFGVERQWAAVPYEDIEDLIETNNRMNCRLQKQDPNGFEPQLNGVIVVEAFYSHDQLLNFPGYHLFGRIPMHVMTAMRRSVEFRE